MSPECHALPIREGRADRKYRKGGKVQIGMHQASGGVTSSFVTLHVRSDMRRNRGSRVGASGVRSALLTEAMTFLEPWILRNNFNSAIKRHQVSTCPCALRLAHR